MHGLKLIKMANNSTKPPPRQYTVQTAPRLSSNGTLISNENDTNPVLLEAKLLESITSINKLISSNTQLEQALQEEMDNELLSALIENDELIIRKIDNARMLSIKLKNMKPGGVEVSLNDKIPMYIGSELVQQMKKKKKEEVGKKKDGSDDSGGMYL